MLCYFSIFKKHSNLHGERSIRELFPKIVSISTQVQIKPATVKYFPYYQNINKKIQLLIPSETELLAAA